LSAIDIILQRRSIRKYKNEEVSAEVREKIIESGRQAPSAANRQPWHFILVTDSKVKEDLSQSRYRAFIKDASFTVVGINLPYDEISEKWGVVDVTIALQNMVLAAEILGVGSCWIGGFYEAKIKEILHIPNEAKVVALVSFGIPAERPAPRPKKELKEILHYNKW